MPINCLRESLSLWGKETPTIGDRAGRDRRRPQGSSPNPTGDRKGAPLLETGVAFPMKGGGPTGQQWLWKWGLCMLLTMLLLGLVVTPAGATSRITRQAAQQQGTTSIGANIYFATGTLQSMFQSSLDQRIPGTVNTAIANFVGTLPPQDQGWASQMATTLIQPSATVLSLTPQRGGLATTVRLSLYPGDPKPIIASSLISFSVANSSTIQVTGHPLSGSPALIDGPLTTFHLPVGQLSGINTTPNCGDSALALNLNVPVTAQLPPLIRQQTFSSSAQPHTGLVSSSNIVPQQATTSLPSYVELPASSLSALGKAIGSWQITDTLSARNIQLSSQGAYLVATADIYWGQYLRVATAVSTLAPSASGGSLVVQVVSTNASLLGIIPFPYNNYNQRIEQIVNSALNSALSGKFYVTDAVVGPNGYVPCVAADSLLMTGTTTIG